MSDTSNTVSNDEEDLLNDDFFVLNYIEQNIVNELFDNTNNIYNENSMNNSNIINYSNIQLNNNLSYRQLPHITITNEMQILLNQTIEVKILELTNNIENDVNTLIFYNEYLFNILNEINNENVNIYFVNQNNINLIIKYSIETAFTNFINMRMFTESEIIRYIYTYFYYCGNNYYVSNINYVKECIINVLKIYLRDKILFELTNPLQQNIQNVKNILTKDQFNVLPNFIYKDLDDNIKKINDKCLICMDIFNELDELKLIKCNHCFHIDCIKPWLTEQSCKCPNCRFELEHINVL